MAVSVIERNLAKLISPPNDLNCPEIFCFNLMFLIALSEQLLSGGTSGYLRKLKR